MEVRNSLHLNYLGNVDTIVQEFQIYFLFRQRLAEISLYLCQVKIFVRWKDLRLRYLGLYPASTLDGGKWMADRRGVR